VHVRRLDGQTYKPATFKLEDCEVYCESKKKTEEREDHDEDDTGDVGDKDTGEGEIDGGEEGDGAGDIQYDGDDAWE
jgi:hypothetical protein